MKFFDRFYLDKEKDIIVNLYKGYLNTVIGNTVAMLLYLVNKEDYYYGIYSNGR